MAYYSELDASIITDLTRALKLELKPNYDEGGQLIASDHKLIESFKEVLKYYMYEADYNKLMEELDG